MKIIINEEQFKCLTEMLLNENDGTQQKKARRIVKSTFPNRDANEVVKDILHRVPNSNLNSKFWLPGVTRIYCDGELRNKMDEDYLSVIIEMISKYYANKFDENLSNLNYSKLVTLFKEVIEREEKNTREGLQGISNTNKGSYKAVKINSYEEAMKYTNLAHWCVTYEENAYKNTVANSCALYFLLKDNYQNVERTKGNNHPFDEYGLSMIAVAIRPNKTLKSCTLRWNHDIPSEYSVDHIMSPAEISEVIGQNIFEVCPPLEENDFIKKTSVYADVGELHDGFAHVMDPQTGKYTYVDKNGDPAVSDENGDILWFEFASDFKDGLAQVELEGYGYLTLNTDFETV